MGGLAPKIIFSISIWSNNMKSMLKKDALKCWERIKGGMVKEEQGQWEANTMILHLQILFSDMNSLIHQILER